jgi:low temperature requirement protein LtrA
VADHQRYVRMRAEEELPVSYIELFFDLVYVFAVTQLSHLLLGDLSWHGALRAALLLSAVWQEWGYTAWATNWFDPEMMPVRAVLIGTILASLVVSSSIPEAFGSRGLWFAGAYVAMQVGRTLAVLWWCREHPSLLRNFQRIIVWLVAGGVLWIAGGFVHGTARDLVWLGAVLTDNIAAFAGFWVPGLGKSGTTDWNITGSHMAERCHLFVIIALGESITVTGVTFASRPPTATALAALTVAFGGSVALWWIYFDRAARSGAAIIAASDDPGRLGRTAYTYLHMPMVAGIIVAAVGDELTLSPSNQHMRTATAAVILIGPALFLVGHLFFKRVVFGVWSVSRLAALAALALLAPIAAVVTPLALALLTTLVVVGVAVKDTIDGRARDRALAAV